MHEITFHIENYCPVLKKANTSHIVRLGGRETDAVPGYPEVATDICGSSPACKTYLSERDSGTGGKGTITVRALGDYDSYTRPELTGPYRVSCTGCQALPKGFSKKVRKP